MIIRSLLGMLSPAGARNRLSVLVFHRVLERPDPLFPSELDAVRFDALLAWIKRYFNVIPLDEALRQLETARLPSRAAAITFDDGYADNFLVALPLLQRHGLTSTFFVATGFLDGGRMWNDTVIESIRASPLATLDLGALNLGQHAIPSIEERRVAIDAVIARVKYLPHEHRSAVANEIAQIAHVRAPNHLMMTSDQVRALHLSGMQIGAHTVSHPILAKLDAPQARSEIADSKLALQELLLQRIGLFAYPNGKPGVDYLPEHATLVRDLGFDAAVSTSVGAARQGTDLFQIPRFTPWDRTPLRFGTRMLANLLKE